LDPAAFDEHIEVAQDVIPGGAERAADPNPSRYTARSFLK
jgi:hypothetical protein